MFSFGSQAEAFKVLKDAQPGEVYDIERVKEGEFQNWVSATKTTAGSVSAQSATATPQKSTSTYTASKSPTAGGSSYPTAEERAKTQVYIVRQSNINSAVATLSVGAKSLKPDDVIALAKRYEDHVFGNSNDPVTAAPAVPFDAATSFDDLDDLPQ